MDHRRGDFSHPAWSKPGRVWMVMVGTGNAKKNLCISLSFGLVWFYVEERIAGPWCAGHESIEPVVWDFRGRIDEIEKTLTRPTPLFSSMTTKVVRVNARGRGVCAAGSSRGGHGNKNHRNGFVRKTICPPERVLRYPDGKERRIRYPSSTGLTLDECPGLEEKLHTVSTDETAVEGGETGPSDVSELDLSSPLAFLRYVTSEAYTRRLEEENRAVRRTFGVHVTCPWVIPRKVWTLGVDGGHANVEGRDDDDDDDEQQQQLMDRAPAAASVFYLRTRSPSTAVENELSSLLFSGSRRIRCSSLVDGIVIFTEEADAEAFAGSMSTDAGVLSVAEHDSHELFRHLVECRGVAVVMKPGFGDEMEACGMGLQGFSERLKAVLLGWSDDEEGDDGGKRVQD